MVFRAYPGINLSRLKGKIIQIFDATYIYLMVHIIIAEAHKKVNISDSSEDQNYWGTVANEDFNEFSRQC